MLICGIEIQVSGIERKSPVNGNETLVWVLEHNLSFKVL